MFLIVLPDLAAEDDLLRRLNRGDQEAVIDAYEQYFPPLFQYLRLKSGDASLAEDIASEVFLKLIAVLGTASAPRRTLRGWLFQVARNELAQHFGKVKQVSLVNLEEWMPAAPESNPEVKLGDFVDLDRVRHALRMLNPDHQEVLILRFGQRLSLQETSDMMGKSVSAIKSMQFRAVTTLRQILVQPDMEANNG